jgi:hypothetical protein
LNPHAASSWTTLDLPVPDIPVSRTRFTRKAYEPDPGEVRGDTAAAGTASQAALTRGLPLPGLAWRCAKACP